MKINFSSIAMAAAAILSTPETHAQMPYNVATLQQPYASLTNATDVTGGTAWSDTSKFTFPVGFNFQLGGNAVNSITLTETTLLLPSLTGTQSGFAILGTSLQDRNYQMGAGISPIRYQVSGTNGSRIFKMEIRNAGFANEKDLYSTSKDSVNLQIWIYENNSTIEFHFGTSSINHFSDYFAGKVPLGYMKNLDMDNFTFEKYYTLKGDPANPGMDTLTNMSNISGLNSFPVSGTVYRFTPKNSTTGISAPVKTTLGKIYPVPAYGMLYVESKASAYDILTLTGAVLSSGTIKGGKASIPLQQLVPGMYLIRLTNDQNQVDIQKFIKSQ